MSELSEWDEENVILTGSMDGVVRMWGIEFFDEAAKNRRSLKLSPKSNDLASPKKQEEKAEAASEESRDIGPETPSLNSQLGPDSSPTSAVKPSVDPSPQFNQPAVSSEQAEPPSGVMNEETCEEKNSEHVTPEVAGDGGTNNRHVTSNLRVDSIDDGFVLIGHKEKTENEELAKPVWKRRLVLRHKLTMHTAFAREDNSAPAAITALLVSKDHRKLLVGDFRGRIYSWSVTDAAGRMADHWVKDEFADLCSGCGIKFTTLIERRHHCRDCGKVFCARCSSYEAEIARLGIHAPVRVCHACYNKIKKSSKKAKS